MYCFITPTLGGIASDDFVKMCNCHLCGKELLGLSMEGWYKDQYPHIKRILPDMAYKTFKGRPACRGCGVKLERDLEHARRKAGEGSGGIRARREKKRYNAHPWRGGTIVQGPGFSRRAG